MLGEMQQLDDEVQLQLSLVAMELRKVYEREPAERDALKELIVDTYELLEFNS